MADQQAARVHEVQHDDQGSADVLLSHQDFPGLQFTLTLAPDGKTVTGFAVRSDPAMPITRRLVVGLPIGELERAAQAVEAQIGPLSRAAREHPPIIGLPPEQPPYSDTFYAAVACDYGVLSAGSSSPVTELANRYGRPRNTVKGWLMEARRRRLLSEPPDRKSPVGKAGGVATRQALDLLSDALLNPKAKKQRARTSINTSAKDRKQHGNKKT